MLTDVATMEPFFAFHSGHKSTALSQSPPIDFPGAGISPYQASHPAYYQAFNSGLCSNMDPLWSTSRTHKQPGTHSPGGPVVPQRIRADDEAQLADRQKL